MNIKLIKLVEPELQFGYEQRVEDPRDGLTLFGPLDKGKPCGIQWGVLGTVAGIKKFKNWVKKVQLPIYNDQPDIARPPFPGFKAIFGIPWSTDPIVEIEIALEDIEKCIHIDDKYQRVYKTVGIFSERIKKALHEEEFAPNIWFVVIPDEVFVYCRPKSIVESNIRIKSESKMSVEYARSIKRETPSFFKELNLDAIPYEYEVHFRNQIKARLLREKITTQVIRESTIAYDDYLNASGKPKRDLSELQSAIAWNISTTVFYKAGGRPWKVGTVREGVCYIGLIFKQNLTGGQKWACCAAQMFLDSGDGVVFKGTDGPYYDPERKTFHIGTKEAEELVGKAINAYEEKCGKPPKEIFIHGKTSFDNEEWEGFQKACGTITKVIGVRIKDAKDLKFYRKGKFAVLRGLACVLDERTAFLWTKGYVPRLQTCMGLEVPRPLEITICRGEANLEVVLNDIMMLTKLNYNSCIFGDGQPVTLKFADCVGEILTAGPAEEVPPLAFKYYI